MAKIVNESRVAAAKEAERQQQQAKRKRQMLFMAKLKESRRKYEADAPKREEEERIRRAAERTLHGENVGKLKEEVDKINTEKVGTFQVKPLMRICTRYINALKKEERYLQDELTSEQHKKATQVSKHER